MVFDIITIGSATVDVFAYTDSSETIKIKNINSEHDYIAYPYGDKIIINDLDFEIGGGGTNTAVSFSRLGLKTAYLGKLGNDANAEKILELLKKENINFIGARGEKTGYSVVLNSIEHERTILTYKGANNELLDSDVVLSNLQTKWLYSSSMIGQSFETLKSIFFVVKKTGAKTAFNPSNYQAKLGIMQLKDVLKNLDVLVLNKEEAQLLLNEQNQNIGELVQKLSSYGPEYVVITDGKNGATSYYKNKIYQIGTSKDLKIVETTGAGDAFASAFVSGLFYGLTIEDCLKLGIIQSEACISGMGAKTNLMFKHDAFEKLKTINLEIKSYVVDKIQQKVQRSFVSPNGKEFTLQNGIQINDLNQLAIILKDMSDDVFNYHTQNGNHFASWIRDVFSMADLASKITSSKSKYEMSDAIKHYLESIGE
jgi:ribokinase